MGKGLSKVEVINDQRMEVYFFGHREIKKPELLEEPNGEIVAFSSSGLGGRRHVFTADQVADVKDMPVSTSPNWLRIILK